MAAVTDALEALTDQELVAVEELAKKCLMEGAALADVQGYTEDEMEAVYHLAYNAYRQGKYADARKLFQFLALNDHVESRFWMGLAATCQMSGDYRQAVAAYEMAAVLEATSPWPPFHAGECYMAMNDWEKSAKALQAVEILCDAADGEGGHAGLRARAAQLSRVVEHALAAAHSRGRPPLNG